MEKYMNEIFRQNQILGVTLKGDPVVHVGLVRETDGKKATDILLAQKYYSVKGIEGEHTIPRELSPNIIKHCGIQTVFNTLENLIRPFVINDL
jgi:hypothetical protein